MKRRFPFAYLASVLVFWAATVGLGRIQDKGQEGPRFLAPPPEHVEYFTFGFRESMADSFWLRWIQDNDVCQTYRGVAKPTAGIKLTKEFDNPRNKVCDNSWAFKMLDAVTRLSPKFKMPYELGAITLSVLTEDYSGASVIFDRAVEAYPYDWSILYRAAYHSLFDMNDVPKAADLFRRAVANGAPQWLELLAARLYTRSGQIEIALATLKQYRYAIQKDSSVEAMEHVEKRIANLERQLREGEDKK